MGQYVRNWEQNLKGYVSNAIGKTEEPNMVSESHLMHRGGCSNWRAINFLQMYYQKKLILYM